jgi:hypothetical protein
MQEQMYSANDRRKDFMIKRNENNLHRPKAKHYLFNVLNRKIALVTFKAHNCHFDMNIWKIGVNSGIIKANNIVSTLIY